LTPLTIAVAARSLTLLLKRSGQRLRRFGHLLRQRAHSLLAFGLSQARQATRAQLRNRLLK
jgi:hypothetical protein